MPFIATQTGEVVRRYELPRDHLLCMYAFTQMYLPARDRLCPTEQEPSVLNNKNPKLQPTGVVINNDELKIWQIADQAGRHVPGHVCSCTQQV